METSKIPALELALACARKVSRIWCAYDAEDKRLQKHVWIKE